VREAIASERAPFLPFDDGAEPLRARVRELERERERLLQEVLHLQRVTQAGLMTSGLAHDLANQMTTVMGGAELALMQGHPEALRKGLRDVLEGSCRVHDTVDAFVSFVRRREHRVRPFFVSESITGVQRLVEPMARGEGVACLATCTSRAQICADRQLVEQALVNLMLNAIRAAAKGGGRVVLSVSDTDHGVARFSVRDTGPGILEDIRRRLFEPFATGSAGEGGTGLGLYIVRQVAERFRGRIAVETSAAGTRIDLDLPVWTG
jgi:signal transduction histidine kinase